MRITSVTHVLQINPALNVAILSIWIIIWLYLSVFLKGVRFMNNLKLSELVQIRVTPQMKKLLQLEAERLGVRPVDIARMALAKSLYNQNPTKTAGSDKYPMETKETQ